MPARVSCARTKHDNQQILEAASVLKEVGAALSLSPGAVTILRRFGVHLEQKGGTPMQDVKVWGHDGVTIGRTTLKARDMYGDDVVRPPTRTSWCGSAE
jgi:2-polyprenyl-6-methoxyphenol hydroxylase-like FAD-dependent oxidoreductase